VRTTVERALGIDKPSPGRVAYDPRTDNIADMRERRIPPQRGSVEAEQLNEVGV
jgi:hypothetical protein